jgi:hypothetical protein
MFGLKSDKFKGEMFNAIKRYNPSLNKTQDQDFMSAYLTHKIKNDKLSYIEHDPFFSKKPFPPGTYRGVNNGGVYFVGQQIIVDNEKDVYELDGYLPDRNLVDTHEMK